MSSITSATIQCSLNNAFAEAFAMDALYDFLTDADAKAMEVIVFTAQFPTLSHPAHLKGDPQYKFCMQLVFKAVQWLMPRSTIEDKLQTTAQVAIGLRSAMGSAEWFSFICEAAEPLRKAHHRLPMMFANFLLDAGVRVNDPSFMGDLLGLAVPKDDVLYTSGTLPKLLLMCLSQRENLTELFQAGKFSDDLGQLVMRYHLPGLERLLNSRDLGDKFAFDLGL